MTIVKDGFANDLLFHKVSLKMLDGLGLLFHQKFILLVLPIGQERGFQGFLQ